MRKRI